MRDSSYARSVPEPRFLRLCRRIQGPRDGPLLAELWRRPELRRRFVVAPLVTALLAAITGVTVAASIRRPEVDGLAERVPRLTTRLTAADGTLVRTYQRENRILLREGEVPPLLERAILATEDSRFYFHGGVDAKGVVRAAVLNLIRGRKSEGASTLTMQLARNLFQLSREKAWWRKVEEAFLAVEIEKQLSKEQILTRYANTVYLGHGLYGMEAGARAYFGKRALDLDLPEAATLAGIPQRPKTFDPYRKPHRVVERRNHVLGRLLAEGHIDRAAHGEAVATPLILAPRQVEPEAEASYFAEEVRRYLLGRYGADGVYDRGLRAVTTLRPDIQRDAEKALRRGLLQLDPEGELQGAVVVLESASGAVRALEGGRDFARSELNRITQSRRQVGSAFKLFVYAAALEQGWTAADTLFDAPAAFPGAGNRLTYSPRNHSRRYYGVSTLRRALERSQNVTAVKLQDLVGVDRVIGVARRCGIRSPLPPYPSLALGAADLEPLELAAAYAAVGSGGSWSEPYLIGEVRAADGRLLEEHQERPRLAFSPEIAHLLRHLLRGVASRGSASRLAGLPLETAGKTGTTNNYTDAWFVGLTPRYTLLVWVGHDRDRRIGPGMTGSAAALPIWKALVEAGLESGWLEAGEAFAPPPPGIAVARIDPRTGLLAREGDPAVEEWFLRGTQPERHTSARIEGWIGLPWYLQEPFYLPKEGERMPADVVDWTAVRRRWAGPST
ncbi:MAG: PBP1A family penicillin-binding protein [Holophagales bacterium]|nr:PBP1A family penicillin-binding protein [Holophagales bacterium]